MTVTSARHGLIIGLKKLNPFVPNALFLYPLKKSENFKNGLSDYSFHNWPTKSFKRALKLCKNHENKENYTRQIY